MVMRTTRQITSTSIPGLQDDFKRELVDFKLKKAPKKLEKCLGKKTHLAEMQKDVRKEIEIMPDKRILTIDSIMRRSIDLPPSISKTKKPMNKLKFDLFTKKPKVLYGVEKLLMKRNKVILSSKKMASFEANKKKLKEFMKRRNYPRISRSERLLEKIIKRPVFKFNRFSLKKNQNSTMKKDDPFDMKPFTKTVFGKMNEKKKEKYKKVLERMVDLRYDFDYPSRPGYSKRIRIGAKSLNTILRRRRAIKKMRKMRRIKEKLRKKKEKSKNKKRKKKEMSMKLKEKENKKKKEKKRKEIEEVKSSKKKDKLKDVPSSSKTVDRKSISSLPKIPKKKVTFDHDSPLPSASSSSVSVASTKAKTEKPAVAKLTFKSIDIMAPSTSKSSTKIIVNSDKKRKEEKKRQAEKLEEKRRKERKEEKKLKEQIEAEVRRRNEKKEEEEKRILNEQREEERKMKERMEAEKKRRKEKEDEEKRVEDEKKKEKELREKQMIEEKKRKEEEMLKLQKQQELEELKKNIQEKQKLVTVDDHKAKIRAEREKKLEQERLRKEALEQEISNQIQIKKEIIEYDYDSFAHAFENSAPPLEQDEYLEEPEEDPDIEILHVVQGITINDYTVDPEKIQSRKWNNIPLSIKRLSIDMKSELFKEYYRIESLTLANSGLNAIMDSREKSITIIDPIICNENGPTNEEKTSKNVKELRGMVNEGSGSHGTKERTKSPEGVEVRDYSSVKLEHLKRKMKWPFNESAGVYWPVIVPPLIVPGRNQMSDSERREEHLKEHIQQLLSCHSYSGYADSTLMLTNGIVDKDQSTQFNNAYETTKKPNYGDVEWEVYSSKPGRFSNRIPYDMKRSYQDREEASKRHNEIIDKEENEEDRLYLQFKQFEEENNERGKEDAKLQLMHNLVNSSRIDTYSKKALDSTRHSSNPGTRVQIVRPEWTTGGYNGFKLCDRDAIFVEMMKCKTYKYNSFYPIRRNKNFSNYLPNNLEYDPAALDEWCFTPMLVSLYYQAAYKGLSVFNDEEQKQLEQRKKRYDELVSQKTFDLKKVMHVCNVIEVDKRLWTIVYDQLTAHFKDMPSLAQLMEDSTLRNIVHNCFENRLYHLSRKGDSY